MLVKHQQFCIVHTLPWCCFPF